MLCSGLCCEAAVAGQDSTEHVTPGQRSAAEARMRCRVLSAPAHNLVLRMAAVKAPSISQQSATAVVF